MEKSQKTQGPLIKPISPAAERDTQPSSFRLAFPSRRERLAHPLSLLSRSLSVADLEDATRYDSPLPNQKLSSVSKNHKIIDHSSACETGAVSVPSAEDSSPPSSQRPSFRSSEKATTFQRSRLIQADFDDARFCEGLANEAGCYPHVSRCCQTLHLQSIRQIK